MKKIAAVIVTYNRRDKLLRCLESVREQTSEVQPDIIVIDNNSSDGTEDAVRDRYCTSYSGRQNRSGSENDPEPGCRVHEWCAETERGTIKYINPGFNSGGAGGFCRGIRETVKGGYDYIWLMDDDCIPAGDALEQFLRFDSSYEGQYGFLSGRVLWKDGSLCRMNLQRETVMRNLRRMPDHPVRVEMASFVSLFIPAHIVADAGLPLKEFFIWTDDWEYTRRISRRYPCWLVPASIAVHDTEVNSGADISSAPSDKIGRFRYLYRNDVYLYRREGLKGFLYESARLAFHAAKIAVSSNSTREKIRRTGIMLGGTADGISFYPVPERVYLDSGTD